MTDEQELPGTPSDQVPAILRTGNSGVETLFLSLAKRHPEGNDADYLRWHSMDHRPEQYRLAGLRSSLRAVSTPECRAVRAASVAEYDAVDHVMQYFFTGVDALHGFGELSDALKDAGRSPFILPPAARGVYRVDSRQAAPRVRVGADVLPWLPLRGIYLVVAEGDAAPLSVLDVDGVAGAWQATSQASPYASAGDGQQLWVGFLDGNPVATARELAPLLEVHWQSSAARPLLAAPFYTVVPYEWERYLP